MHNNKIGIGVPQVSYQFWNCRECRICGAWNKSVNTIVLVEWGGVGWMLVYPQNYAAEAQHGPCHDNGIYVIRANQGDLKGRSVRRGRISAISGVERAEKAQLTDVPFAWELCPS